MSTTVTSRLEGLVASLAQKAPCVLKTTANHALSGLSAIDGVTPTAGQRILVGSQTDATQNGIYVAASGAWARAADFDGTYDAVGGTQVSVILGSTNSNSYWKVDGSSAITIGTDSITFSAALIDDSATAAFIASGAGAVARTVQAKLRDMPTPQDFGVSLESTSQGIGTDVLQLVTTGTRNTAFGYRALKADTSGSENTAFGYLALTAAVGGVDPAGSYNTAFGSFALSAMTTGYKNSAFGRASADNVTTGYENTALGYGSLHFCTDGYQNTAVGMEAVHDVTSGLGNTGVGAYALREVEGNYNTGVGRSAGQLITTGTRNTGIGDSALYGTTTGTENTAIGYNAGVTHTGNTGTFVGKGADANAGLSSVTVVGAGVVATASNTFVIPGGITFHAAADDTTDIGSASLKFGYGYFGKSVSAWAGTAIPAGGTAGRGFLLSSTSNFGVFFGSGAPTLTAAKGSLYMRSDGSGTTNRAYINTDGGTTWTALTTAA